MPSSSSRFAAVPRPPCARRGRWCGAIVNEPVLSFVIGRAIDDEYFLVNDAVLDIDVPVLLTRGKQPHWKWFTAEERTSVMRVIAALRPSRNVIGGNAPDAVPVDVYEALIAQFPTEVERAKYMRARISGVVRQHTDAKVDAVADLAAYVGRRTVQRSHDLRGMLHEAAVCGTSAQISGNWSGCSRPP